jgi:hypothetical protein
VVVGNSHSHSHSLAHVGARLAALGLGSWTDRSGPAPSRNLTQVCFRAFGSRVGVAAAADRMCSRKEGPLPTWLKTQVPPPMA